MGSDGETKLERAVKAGIRPCLSGAEAAEVLGELRRLREQLREDLRRCRECHAFTAYGREASGRERTIPGSVAAAAASSTVERLGR